MSRGPRVIQICGVRDDLIEARILNDILCDIDIAVRPSGNVSIEQNGALIDLDLPTIRSIEKEVVRINMCRGWPSDR